MKLIIVISSLFSVIQCLQWLKKKSYEPQKAQKYTEKRKEEIR